MDSGVILRGEDGHLKQLRGSAAYSVRTLPYCGAWTRDEHKLCRRSDRTHPHSFYQLLGESNHHFRKEK